MKQLVPASASTAAKAAAGIVLLAAGTGVAFAAWIENGAGIFLSLVEAGLSWCF